MINTINLGGQLIDVSKPSVMAIVNVTPDSFHDGGSYTTTEALSRRVTEVVGEGASFVDIGAFSTRPGSQDVPLDVELERLLPAARLTRELYPSIPVSIDTFRSEVVQRVFDEVGAIIVNDISGGELDQKMLSTVGSLHLPYICMHMRGTPQTMQQFTKYSNLVSEVIDYFARKIVTMKEAGIVDFILDPGFGFSKTLDQNYELLSRLEQLGILDAPILVGLSRKSMIWKLLGITPDEALNGTTALHVIALQKGASILRVHDVKAAREVISLCQKR